MHDFRRWSWNTVVVEGVCKVWDSEEWWLVRVINATSYIVHSMSKLGSPNSTFSCYQSSGSAFCSFTQSPFSYIYNIPHNINHQPHLPIHLPPRTCSSFMSQLRCTLIYLGSSCQSHFTDFQFFITSYGFFPFHFVSSFVSFFCL